MDHKRVYGRTPAGGDYSEIYYMDDQHNIVDSSEATRCVIRECKNDGELIRETWGICEPKKGSPRSEG